MPRSQPPRDFARLNHPSLARTSRHRAYCARSPRWPVWCLFLATVTNSRHGIRVGALCGMAAAAAGIIRWTRRRRFGPS